MEISVRENEHDAVPRKRKAKRSLCDFCDKIWVRRRPAQQFDVTPQNLSSRLEARQFQVGAIFAFDQQPASLETLGSKSRMVEEIRSQSHPDEHNRKGFELTLSHHTTAFQVDGSPRPTHDQNGPETLR